MFGNKVSATVKGLTEEMVSTVDLDRNQESFMMLAGTMEQIIPTMTEAEVDYILEKFDRAFIRRSGKAQWQRQIAADLIVLLRTRKL